MSNTTRQSFQMIYAGGAVHRYHTKPTIGKQSNAEHQWGVAIIVDYIYPQASKELILAALFHVRMREMVECGLLSPGDALVIRGYPDSEAIVESDGNVIFKNEPMTANQWGMQVTGMSVSIYIYAEVKESGRLLDDLRNEYAGNL